MIEAIVLQSCDNVAVLPRSISEGEAICLDGQTLTISSTIGLGHKLARFPIPCGSKITKYGVPIGSATCDISPGEHVHLHNMKSDYLPTYNLDEGRQFSS